MNRFRLDINFYDLIFLGTILVGFTFVMLLMFTKRANRKANFFLGLSLLTIVLWMVWVLAIDIHLEVFFPYWSWLPLQFSLTLGPLLYLYVRLLTQPHLSFKINDLWHFSPMLAEQAVQVFQVMESRDTHQSTYNTVVFTNLNPLLQLAALISVITYLGMSLRLLRRFQASLKDQFSDTGLYHYRWLKRLLIIFGLLWLLWIPFVAVDYVFFQYNLGISAYYPLYLALAVVTIWISAEAFLRPEVIFVDAVLPARKQTREIPDEQLLARGEWLRRQMMENLFHLDPGLSLQKLASELGIHPNELSRITNVALGKTFSDFVNEYRVQAVVQKMSDPAFQRITLLGIAYDSGFNSKTTFNRTFKQITGESPVHYKNGLQTGARLQDGTLKKAP